ncbi:isoprenylcysteine carboxylmethyltransferase family protein [Actinomycetes bacterium KLBMP 9797]
MRTSRAALTSAAFFVAAPGTVAGLIPWLISRWEFPGWGVGQVIGVVLVCVGVVPVVHAFAQFVRAGGTPIPTAPTRRLVVSGANRYIRNPMYAGLLLAIAGQALLFGQPSLLLYGAIVWAITATFVRWYEEPTLTRRFGAEYTAYRRAVPAWWPRLRPWHPQ